VFGEAIARIYLQTLLICSWDYQDKPFSKRQLVSQLGTIWTAAHRLFLEPIYDVRGWAWGEKIRGRCGIFTLDYGAGDTGWVLSTIWVICGRKILNQENSQKLVFWKRGFDPL
jgi:hypothetical protein